MKDVDSQVDQMVSFLIRKHEELENGEPHTYPYVYQLKDGCNLTITGHLHDDDLITLLCIRKLVKLRGTENKYKPFDFRLSDIAFPEGAKLNPANLGMAYDSIVRLFSVRARIKNTKVKRGRTAGFHLISGWLEIGNDKKDGEGELCLGEWIPEVLPEIIEAIQ